MKKFMIKATALAIGALVGSSAFAAPITAPVSLADAATAKTFAKELSYSVAGAATSLNPTTDTTILSFNTPLGFGVAAATTRYIRVDFGNAVLQTALGSTIDTNISIGTLTAGQSSVAISAGGGAGDAYVIFAVAVSGTDVSQASNAVVRVLVPALRVTSTAAPVTATYSLHETGTSAVAGVGGNAQLWTKSGTIAKFASGLDYTVTEKATLTASVEAGFKSFVTGTNVIAQTGVNTAVKLGTLNYDVVGTVLENDGSTVELADLVAATGTKVNVTGDFSAVAGANAAANLPNVFIAAAADCSTKAGSIPATSLTSTTASFTIDQIALAGRSVCYWVNGTSAVPAAEYKAAIAVAAAGGTSTAAFSDAALSPVVRDGSELHAPFATIYSGTGNRVSLTSTHTADANVAASVITETGVTCTGGTSSFTLKAGKQLFINASDVCPTLSTGTRFAMKFIIAAPNSKIFGVYNSYTYDAATAKVTDISSYPLQRPAN